MQTKGFTYGTIIMYTQSIPLLWVGTIARLDCWTQQIQLVQCRTGAKCTSSLSYFASIAPSLFQHLSWEVRGHVHI